MVHFILTTIVGTIGVTLVGIGILLQFGVGPDTMLAPVIDIASASFAGSVTAAPLGMFTGVTGGFIGALVGVGFAVLPLSILFTHTQFPSLVASLVVAAILSTTISVFLPH